jgi:hypothetical protein
MTNDASPREWTIHGGAKFEDTMSHLLIHVDGPVPAPSERIDVIEKSAYDQLQAEFDLYIVATKESRKEYCIDNQKLRDLCKELVEALEEIVKLDTDDTFKGRIYPCGVIAKEALAKAKEVLGDE